MKNYFKAYTVAILLFAVLCIALSGCEEAPITTEGGTTEPTSTATSIPTVITKDEAKTVFLKAIKDTLGAKSITFKGSNTSSRTLTVDGEVNEAAEKETISVTVVTDAEGKAKAYVIHDREANGNKISREVYYMNGKAYRFENNEIGKDDLYTDISVENMINPSFTLVKSVDSLFSAVFTDASLDEKITVEGRTVKFTTNEYTDLAVKIVGEEYTEDELKEILSAMKEFSFTFECTVGEDGYISAVSYDLNMVSSAEGRTGKLGTSLKFDFSQVNSTEDKGLPTWLDEYLKNPENFADSIQRDENGNILWYEINTAKDGNLVKIVRYNPKGSVISYREFTYDDKNRKLTDIEYSAGGTELNKTVIKYEDGEDGNTVSITESKYENGELKTVYVAHFVDESLSATTYYENGVPARKEHANGDTTYYYYTPDGKLFCYWTDCRMESDKYYDAEGKELTFQEYHELTYFVEEYDDKGRCIKKTEYNLEKWVQGIITFTYHENGKLASELKTDKNSYKLWEKTYYENGSLKEDIVYSDNQIIIKKVKSYSEDGRLLTETIYENSGDFIVYHYNGNEHYTKIDRFGPNGKLAYSADYDEKERITKEYIYNVDGSLKSYNTREYYSEVNCIITFYDADGNELRKFDTANSGSGG